MSQSIDFCPKVCYNNIELEVWLDMKKQNLINLVKYHVEKNEDAFRSEVIEIAKEFDVSGDQDISEYLMDLISTTNYYTPQAIYKNFQYLRKVNYINSSLLLPDSIKEDIIGIVRSITNNFGINKILFYGAPGTGKTESAYQRARLLQRDALTVDFESLIDSRLGQTAKNMTQLFNEINRVQSMSAIIIFDEIDSIVLDRVNKNDMREMGRVTSVFLKNLDALNKEITIIATTNLYDLFDKAILRRFDAKVSFDRYGKDDLIDIADSILLSVLKKSTTSKQDARLFHKILKNRDNLPNPGDLQQIIKTAVAFSDVENEFDYLRKIYIELNKDVGQISIQTLQQQGYTTREIEILTRIPKSSVSRKLRG